MAFEDDKQRILRDEMLALLKDPVAAEAVANATWPSIAKKQRAQEQQEADQRLWPVILNDGADVTALSDGTEVWGGPSRFPRLNFLHARNVNIHDAYNKNQVDIDVRGGGGTDCMFDWIVSSCWAEEVTPSDGSTSRGAEGDQFTSLTGCTFYVTSTVQNAWDGVGDGAAAGLKETGSEQVCYICPGDAGPLAISGDDGVTLYGITFIGSGEASIINAPSGAALTISGGARRLTFRDLKIGNTDFAAPFTITDGGDVSLVHCTIGITTSAAPTFTSLSATGQQLFAYDTTFNSNQSGGYALDMSTCGTDSTLFNCTFNDRLRPGGDTHIRMCRFNIGSSSIGIDASSEIHEFWVQGCEFRGSAGSFIAYISCSGSGFASEDIHISGNFATLDATQAVLIDAGFLGSGAVHHSITNNDWACALGLNYTGTVSAARGNYSGNTHKSSSGTAFAYAQGEFDGWEFDGNAPAYGYVALSGDSDNNRIGGIQDSAGVPSHVATQRQLCINKATNDLYMNTSTLFGSTWTLMVPAGGAAAAFAPRYNLYLTGTNMDSWLEGATITQSGAVLTLGTDGDMFHVGAGNFSTIATPTRQTLVLLIFDGVSVLTHGANLILQGAANFTSAAGDSMLLAWEGSTVWREINRHTAAALGGLTAGVGIDITGSTISSFLAQLQPSPTMLTIASGAITPTRSYHTLEGEGAADDELTTITDAAPYDGKVLFLRRTTQNITFTTAGNIALPDSLAWRTGDGNEIVMFIYFGSAWNLVPLNLEHHEIRGVTGGEYVQANNLFVEIGGALRLDAPTRTIASDQVLDLVDPIGQIASESGVTDDFDGMHVEAINNENMFALLRAEPGHTITITHLNAGGTVGNKFVTSTGASIVMTGANVVLCLFDVNLDSGNGAWATFPLYGWVSETDADWIDLTDGGATTLHTHSGGAGHTIRENGTDQTARTGLNFVDAGAGTGLVVDDAGGDETEIHLDLYILKSIFAAKGDLLGASANDAPAIITAGANGTMPMYDSAQSTGVKPTSPAMIAWALG